MINTKPTTSFVYDKNQNLNIKCSIKLNTSNYKNYSFYATGIFNQFVKSQNNNWIFSLTGFYGSSNSTNNFDFIVSNYYFNNWYGINSNNLQVKTHYFNFYQ